MTLTPRRIGLVAALLAGMVAIGSPAHAANPGSANTQDVAATGQAAPEQYDIAGPFASSAACEVTRTFDSWPFGKTACYSILTTPPGYRLWYYGRRIPVIEG
jgi:hypothetical protein